MQITKAQDKVFDTWRQGILSRLAMEQTFKGNQNNSESVHLTSMKPCLPGYPPHQYPESVKLCISEVHCHCSVAILFSFPQDLELYHFIGHC